jgi:hypothetical protein
MISEREPMPFRAPQGSACTAQPIPLFRLPGSTGPALLAAGNDPDDQHLHLETRGDRQDPQSSRTESGYFLGFADVII